MEDHTTTKLNGIPVDLALTFTDRAGAAHRLLVAGPYLRCLDHSGTISRDNVTAALVAVSQKRTCERMRVAWQRQMLTDDRTAKPHLRGLPAQLAAYLADQTARHVARLDAALGSGPRNARSRARWHSVGWRAAPTLAAAYQAAGIEAGVAFLALRRHLDPEDVPAAVKDPSSPIGLAMRKSRRSDKIELLDLGFRPTVTDDFPYEPFTP
ncbi:MAG: hypothetical protein JWN29_2640 [Acidimicrobiales bacterium]|nr:hypothetical protein [Acidimicrobiales bacterium]